MDLRDQPERTPPVTLAVAVAAEVRRRLTALNVSQNALARSAKMPPTLLHRTLAGERQLTLDEFAAIAFALRLSPEYLLRQAVRNTPPTDDTASD